MLNQTMQQAKQKVTRAHSNSLRKTKLNEINFKGNTDVLNWLQFNQTFGQKFNICIHFTMGLYLVCTLYEYTVRIQIQPQVKGSGQSNILNSGTKQSEFEANRRK